MPGWAMVHLHCPSHHGVCEMVSRWKSQRSRDQTRRGLLSLFIKPRGARPPPPSEASMPRTRQRQWTRWISRPGVQQHAGPVP
ncbi:hypothetical protein N658DRAFT_59945 [Parathielavia hyrcaniae]|uniref:Uncharacterized protein n=1 Tax=Parathielavia hyrcaniae TaxID=113614 RepID=A0AAN6Q367_9PEZI|nr:hypothetical protein N658DRAFT_59945 [Parathielavia hyrcaniae]